MSHTQRIHTYISSYKHNQTCSLTFCLKYTYVSYNTHCGCIYTDVPAVEITATGGCGYVNVSWIVPDDNDVCPVRTSTIKLSSSKMDELASVIITQNQHTFNELPFNTLFYVTVFSHYAYVSLNNSVTTSVRTMDHKGMYVQVSLVIMGILL